MIVIYGLRLLLMLRAMWLLEDQKPGSHFIVQYFTIYEVVVILKIYIRSEFYEKVMNLRGYSGIDV